MSCLESATAVLRASQLLAKYFAASGLTTAIGTSRRRRWLASGIQ
jgi:hypothetical protein